MRENKKLPCGCIVSQVNTKWYFDSLCNYHSIQYFDEHKSKKLVRKLNWCMNR